MCETYSEEIISTSRALTHLPNLQHRDILPPMKSLVGLLLVVSGAILAIHPVYEVLAYLEYEGWPIVQGILGTSCIIIGLVFLTLKEKRRDEKKFVEVG